MRCLGLALLTCCLSSSVYVSHMRSEVLRRGDAGPCSWDEAMCGADARLSAADPSSSLVMNSWIGGRGYGR